MTNKTNGGASLGSLEALKAQLAGQLVGHHVGVPASDKYEKATNYVFAKNGLFRVVKTPIALFKTIEKKWDKPLDVPGLAGEMEEGVELLVPKIPFKYWLQVYHWYKDVDTKDKTEASILFFWNTNNVELPDRYVATEAQKAKGELGDPVKGLTQDGQLIIYCPRQENSPALSKFGHDGMVQYLREHTTPLLETHSHNTMGAFFSSTDDANENMNQFYAVYGKIQDECPAFVFRFCSGKHKIQCTPEFLFDMPMVEVTTVEKRKLQLDGVDFEVPDAEFKEYEAYKGPWPLVEYPEDWMGQHTKTANTYTGYPKGPGKYSRYGSTGGAGGKNLPTPRSGYGDHWDGYGYYDQYGYGAHFEGGTEQQSAAKKAPGSLKKTENASLGNPMGTVESDEGATRVEIFASAMINELEPEEVKDVIAELIDNGYDYVLLDYVKELGGGIPDHDYEGHGYGL